MAKVTIDGHMIEVPDGTTILQAARMIGGDVVPPAMCYYSKLKTSGGYCRTCLVKVTKGSEKDPRPMPKPVASCRTPVMDGMEVQNKTAPDLLEARAGVVEFLLINHPLDCPICDQAGECSLQDLAYEHGLSRTRYEFSRRTFQKIDIGEKIKLHMTRCILCYRCVKVAEQITDGRVTSSSISSVTVAENKRFCLFLGSKSNTRINCGRKPRFSISSNSSITRRFTFFRFRAPFNTKSNNLPGVATTISAPAFSKAA